MMFIVEKKAEEDTYRMFLPNRELLEQIFEYISKHGEVSQKVFFGGQIYDAFSLIVSLIQKIESTITSSGDCTLFAVF